MLDHRKSLKKTSIAEHRRRRSRQAAAHPRTEASHSCRSRRIRPPQATESKDDERARPCLPPATTPLPSIPALSSSTACRSRPPEPRLDRTSSPRHHGRPERDKAKRRRKQSALTETLHPRPPRPAGGSRAAHQRSTKNTEIPKKMLLYRRRRRPAPGASSPPHHPQHPHSRARAHPTAVKKGNGDKSSTCLPPSSRRRPSPEQQNPPDPKIGEHQTPSTRRRRPGRRRMADLFTHGSANLRSRSTQQGPTTTPKLHLSTRRTGIRSFPPPHNAATALEAEGSGGDAGETLVAFFSPSLNCSTG